jgi:exodeoxyribonuclease VII small subunit
MTKDTTDYKTLSSKLDEVVATMQAPDITVDDAIAAYEEGIQLVQQIENYLKTAELKITKLTTE